MDSLVSVIIPTYKRSEFLKRAIESVLNQTYAHIEVVVIDDNFPQSKFRRDTEKKMKYFESNSKVKYYKNEENMGGALARNEGIKFAEGKYISFLDDDDIYEPLKIESQLKFMKKLNLDLCFTNIKIMNESYKLIDYRNHFYIKSFFNESLLKYHLMYHLTPTNTYMFKKEALLKIGCFDDAVMGQEFKLMLKAIESNLSIGYTPDDYVIQFLHANERISLGPNKIKAEIELFNHKKKYFHLLKNKEIKYITFRHYAVMAIVNKRSSNSASFLKYSIKALKASPCFFLKELISKIKLVVGHRKTTIN
ncbi:glycosyltransferase family 2 protein [Exiguobacterium acetylicum]|uniref:glycosyltransferase family 2 protein n=1 Tax=Exiguobacterium acetylicum TaxID=41170 RepID=UPI0034D44408